MKAYFNPGNESFTKDANSRIYIDKTGLLTELNQVLGTNECCIAVSHARRFGKSQAAGMIEAYYSLGCDSLELFSRFEIAASKNFKRHLNQYNVIHLDVSSVIDFTKENLVEECIRRISNDFKTEFGEQLNYEDAINVLINNIYQMTRRPFVIILDEWDCVIRNCADRQDIVHKYLQFLHALFKSEESKKYLALGYITGILPIKKIKNESALNNFREYTMLESDCLTKYFGFTEDEVIALCNEFNMNYDSVKEWYDGYVISGMHMYNPNSVYEAMTRHRLASYWKNTSSFETINDLISLNMEHLKDDVLKMLEGKSVFVKTDSFKNDLTEIHTKDDALTALIHLGYLGYDAESNKAFIPNFEVAKAYEAALTTGNWKEIAKTVSRCDELLSATIEMDSSRVAELVELAHDAYSSVLEYNNENSLSCALTMAYFTAPAYYNVVREFPAGKGFADLVLIPRADAKGKPAMVIELKWNKLVDTAISQIKNRRYAESLLGFSGEVLLVGISYDKESTDKKHQCIIERFDII